MANGTHTGMAVAVKRHLSALLIAGGLIIVGAASGCRTTDNCGGEPHTCAGKHTEGTATPGP
jgi:hypothetical protein